MWQGLLKNPPGHVALVSRPAHTAPAQFHRAWSWQGPTCRADCRDRSCRGCQGPLAGAAALSQSRGLLVTATSWKQKLSFRQGSCLHFPHKYLSPFKSWFGLILLIFSHHKIFMGSYYFKKHFKILFLRGKKIQNENQTFWLKVPFSALKH